MTTLLIRRNRGPLAHVAAIRQADIAAGEKVSDSSAGHSTGKRGRIDSAGRGPRCHLVLVQGRLELVDDPTGLIPLFVGQRLDRRAGVPFVEIALNEIQVSRERLRAPSIVTPLKVLDRSRFRLIPPARNKGDKRCTQRVVSASK